MRKSLAIAALFAGPLLGAGCEEGQSNVLGGVQAIAYISSEPVEPGNVFDYANAGTNGNIFTLTPPSASGVKKNLTNWTGGAIHSMDLSFDAREIVFSGQAPGEDHYHIFRINVDGSNPCDAEKGKVSIGACQITDGANDEVYPIYLPGGRIFYTTNKSVEGPEVPQFRDEYERATTSQVGVMSKDGSDQILGPRNVSHRVSPYLRSDGRILLTEWRHLGEVNEGDLITMNQDLTGVREAFGREGNGITNAYLHAKEVAPGKVVTIGTSRDRTFQSGKIVLVDLGGAALSDQSEARSSYVDLTPDVPGDREPSFPHIGRYYDATLVGDVADLQLLVTWADGAVETETLAAAKASPDFGIYVYDGKSHERKPVVNEVGKWEFSPIAIVQRAEPVQLKDSFEAEDTQSTLISALNVYDSTIFPNLVKGSVKKVRISEGFSSEEGFPNMFGLTEFDGMARLGEVDVGSDGAFKALVPPNVPVRLQLIDKYGMAVGTDGDVMNGSNASEPLWIQGRPGEARMCGGCHEDRTKTPAVAPGSLPLQALGAAAFDFPGKLRQERKSDTYTYEQVMGVPWDKALQPIFDEKCVACHDGSAGAANPSYSLMDVTDMVSFSFTFDLTSKPVELNFGDQMYTYSASHVTLLGPSMALREKQVVVTSGEIKTYVEPGSARGSDVIRRLNPPARFPAVDLNDRAFGAMPQHPADVGTYNGVDGTRPEFQLTPDEYYLLILMADNGGQYYARENAGGNQ
jgi:hypothetical protein